MERQGKGIIENEKFPEDFNGFLQFISCKIATIPFGNVPVHCITQKHVSIRQMSRKDRNASISSIRKSLPPKGVKDGERESIIRSEGEVGLPLSEFSRECLSITNFEGHDGHHVKGSVVHVKHRSRHVRPQDSLKLPEVDVFGAWSAPLSLCHPGLSLLLFRRRRNLRSMIRKHRFRVVIAFTSHFGFSKGVAWREEPEVVRITTLPIFGVKLSKSGLDTPGAGGTGTWGKPGGEFLFATIEFGARAGVWFFLSRINALTISFSSTTSDETVGVEELVLTLETMALLRD
ncbi:hypothetical protein Tco_0653312 [Tanacetum coccineum]|uniref:Uncharacterized protein n=1 Tax=Tanacetum coccineum TaxID=301880 RepID=A0ABQ4X012_9ASTR